MPSNGVYCVEGVWNDNLSRRISVQPILELLERQERVPYVHRNFSTREELENLIGQWTLKKYGRFPILYIASHGARGTVQVGNEEVTLDDIAEMFVRPVQGRAVVFGTCSTVGVSQKQLRQFMDATGVSIVCGYKTDVDWVLATAFELVLLYGLQQHRLRGGGVPAVKRTAKSLSRLFGAELAFRVESRSEGSQ